MYLRSPMKNEEMNKTLKLSKRLRAAADLVRQDAYIADVGTDHAYLPIALCLEERVRGAVASDINEGPILRAREHISAYGFDTRINTVLADGLDKISSYEPTDILILGMGGELIVNIISRASFLKNETIRLILQPMTHPEILRSFLLKNGYSIVDEALVLEEKKVYQIICAEYTGKTEEYSDVELLLGKKNIERGGQLLIMSVERFIAVFSERLRGKKISGADISEEEKILSELEELK